MDYRPKCKIQNFQKKKNMRKLWDKDFLARTQKAKSIKEKVINWTS